MFCKQHRDIHRFSPSDKSSKELYFETASQLRVREIRGQTASLAFACAQQSPPDGSLEFESVRGKVTLQLLVEMPRTKLAPNNISCLPSQVGNVNTAFPRKFLLEREPFR